MTPDMLAIAAFIAYAKEVGLPRDKIKQGVLALIHEGRKPQAEAHDASGEVTNFTGGATPIPEQNVAPGLEKFFDMRGRESQAHVTGTKFDALGRKRCYVRGKQVKCLQKKQEAKVRAAGAGDPPKAERHRQEKEDEPRNQGMAQALKKPSKPITPMKRAFERHFHPENKEDQSAALKRGIDSGHPHSRVLYRGLRKTPNWDEGDVVTLPVMAFTRANIIEGADAGSATLTDDIEAVLVIENPTKGYDLPPQDAPQEHATLVYGDYKVMKIGEANNMAGGDMMSVFHLTEAREK